MDIYIYRIYNRKNRNHKERDNRSNDFVVPLEELIDNRSQSTK